MAKDVAIIERAIKARGYTIYTDGDHKKVKDPYGNVVRVGNVPLEMASTPSDWRATNNMIRTLVNVGVLDDDPRRSGAPKRITANGGTAPEVRAQIIRERALQTLVEMGIGVGRGAAARLAELVGATGLMNKNTAQQTLLAWSTKQPKSVTQKTFDAFQIALDNYWGIETPSEEKLEVTEHAPFVPDEPIETTDVEPARDEHPEPDYQPLPEDVIPDVTPSWGDIVRTTRQIKDELPATVGVGPEPFADSVDPLPAEQDRELTELELSMLIDRDWALEMLGEFDMVTQPDAKAAIMARIGTRLVNKYDI